MVPLFFLPGFLSLNDKKTSNPFFFSTVDCIQEFRRLALTEYGLEPLYYYTLPSLSLAAALKTTKIRLQLISDPNIYLFLEAYLKGGISVVRQRRATTNLPEAPDYNPDLPRTANFYHDMVSGLS